MDAEKLILKILPFVLALCAGLAFRQGVKSLLRKKPESEFLHWALVSFIFQVLTVISMFKGIE